ncbi:MAG: protein translocase subunit SecF [Bryobacterales bacterium]|nr:protein translocase subunit SecF [Bryobacterales bacterium]
MEIFQDSNFDFLGKRWLFIGLSALLIGAGLVSLVIKGGPRYGIDFSGGSVIRLRFQSQPPVEKIRSVLAGAVKGEITVQGFTDSAAANEVIIGTQLEDERSLDASQSAILQVLESTFGKGAFEVRSREIVGPKVGSDLRRQAILATLYALAGMLVYIAFRFEWIYGAAAVLAVFHDVIVTVGLFSIFNREISLTVIAALLTLVGYSMNDTIVIFDRVRENLKILRRETLEALMNKSINQTLSRSILTSGLTLVSVLALFLFGGTVLNDFAFALVAGIIVGSYSTLFIASPIVLFWQNFREGRKKGSGSPVISAARPPVQTGRPGSKKGVPKPAR